MPLDLPDWAADELLLEWILDCDRKLETLTAQPNFDPGTARKILEVRQRWQEILEQKSTP